MMSSLRVEKRPRKLLETPATLQSAELAMSMLGRWKCGFTGCCLKTLMWGGGAPKRFHYLLCTAAERAVTTEQ